MTRTNHAIYIVIYVRVKYFFAETETSSSTLPSACKEQNYPARRPILSTHQDGINIRKPLVCAMSGEPSARGVSHQQGESLINSEEPITTPIEGHHEGHHEGQQTASGPSDSCEAAPGSKAFASPSRWLQQVWQIWLQGKGMLLVLLAQFFGATMNVMARLLERDGPHGKGMAPFQVCFLLPSYLVVLRADMRQCATYRFYSFVCLQPPCSASYICGI